jgi:hypothetical protein
MSDCDRPLPDGFATIRHSLATERHKMRHAFGLGSITLAIALLVGCAPADAPQAAAEAPNPQGATDAAHAAPTTDAVASGTKACMIAGEFELMGRRIRSRDCLQAGAEVADASHRDMCEGLAQTSAQMGGKAGEVTYMETCPTPAQGSCKGLFGQGSMHAFHYERDADDLATLPQSCEASGGTWLP